MNKLVLVALVGLLIFTACQEGTNDDNITALKTPAQIQDNIINFDAINISSIKIKELNTGQDSILIKDGIIQEFCGSLNGMKFTKIDESFIPEYEAEILDGGEPILKISFSGNVVSFNEKVMIGNKVIESGDYELENWISQNIEHFYEGKVLDPQNIELPANIYLPESEFELEIVDNGSTKVNQKEIYSQLFEFVTESFCNRKFEIVEYRRVDDFELMEQQKQNARENSRAIIINNSGGYLKVDSENEYDESISAPSIVLSEYAQKPEIYQLYANSMIIDIKAEDEFVRGFKDVFDTNAKQSRNLTPDEIEELFNEKQDHYMDYICKNLGIENWYGNEPQSLEKSKMSLNSHGKPYTVLSFVNGFSVRLLFFKEDKFIDYIDFGGKMAGTEYRFEKAGDKVFVVGKSCRGYGTGLSRYFEDWYLLNDQGKKLVVSFPYSIHEYYLSFPGYNLNATSIKFNSKKDISITIEYNIKKDYFKDMNYYMNNEVNEELTVEDTKKVVFKWNDEKAVFISEYVVDDMGLTEIPPESKEMKNKCTDILKKKYKKLTRMALAVTEEKDIDRIEVLKRVWEYFLNDCEDCDEKAALLEILSKEY